MAGSHRRNNLLRAVAIVGGLLGATEALFGQAGPPVRPIGSIRSTSSEPFASVSQARAISGGRVLVNDIVGRRVLLLDSTLKLIAVIEDSAAMTAGRAYGPRSAGLIAYRNDSTLFVDPSSLSMSVIDANGKVTRTMAVPRPGEAGYLVGGPYGTPAADSQGRIVARSALRVGVPSVLPPGTPPSVPDSALVVRYNLETRAVDTVARVGIAPMKFALATMDFHGTSVSEWTSVIDPVPWVDDWALLSDGSIAVIRGREYRVEFFGVDGKASYRAKIPFEWQRLTDADKAALIDSTRSATERLLSERAGSTARAGTPSQSSQGRVGSASQQPTPPLLFSSLNEISDYRPAFRAGAARGDADGNLWIRTSRMVNGGAVYDVVNSTGALIDRVQVPSGRVIAGFGPGGVVYMGYLDGPVARVERASVR